MSRGRKAKKKTKLREQPTMASLRVKEEIGSLPIRHGLPGGSKSAVIRPWLCGGESAGQSAKSPSNSCGCDVSVYRQPRTAKKQRHLGTGLTNFFKGDELQRLRKVLQKSDLSNTPLLLGAIILGKLDVVKKLLKDGYPINSCTEDKKTPLMWAVSNKNLEMINLLVEHGADLTLVDKNRDNIALIAIQSPSWSETDFLDFWNSIHRKIDPGHTNIRGNTILHYAVKRQWDVLVELLRKEAGGGSLEDAEDALSHLAIGPETVEDAAEDPAKPSSSKNHASFGSIAGTLEKNAEVVPRRRVFKEDKDQSETHIEMTSDDVEETILYLSTLFEEIVRCYRRDWQRDRELGYPGYRDGQGDPAGSSEEERKIRQEEIARLNAILPKLENSYMKKLRDGWSSLTEKMRQTGSRDPRIFRGIAASLRVQLVTHHNSSGEDPDGNLERLSEQRKNPGTIGDGAMDCKGTLEELPGSRLESRTPARSHLMHRENSISEGSHSSERRAKVLEISQKDRCPLRSPSDPERHAGGHWGIFERERVPAEDASGGSGGVVCTAEMEEALRTRITMNSSCPLPELVRPDRSGASWSSREQQVVEGPPQKSSLAPVNESNYVNRFNNPNEPAPTSYVSRWDALVKSLRSQGEKSKPRESTLTLCSPEQRKFFVISPGGNFGSVELGLQADGRPLAIRRMLKELGVPVFSLLQPLLGLRHENLLPFIACTNVGSEVVLATPLCEYNLGEYLMYLKMSKRLEERARSLVLQFLSGLRFLHTGGEEAVVHGNIKPSNLMIDASGTLKLAEFGLWKALYRNGRPPSSSMIWFARESYRAYKEDQVLICTRATDVQVAGMVVHFILTGGLHPYGTQSEDILENIVRGCPRVQNQGCEVVDLVSWMLLYDPLERPSIEQVLTHVFFWESDKKWSFLLACAGVTVNGARLPLSLDTFHKDLETKPLFGQVKGNWLSALRAQFPYMRIDGDFEDSPTGLLNFLRNQMEVQPSVSHRMQQFLLRAFPALTLSLYRLLTTTRWLFHPVFLPYTKDQ
ncbi:uncharacterized protein LOC105696721 [Orussus abietinus]|uniref:uncharacterized protein LOC105696721 n=1 Tax=Orussus abietinus TaxID=222816 RepID=UPI0006255CD0|nr:uncharacterized protein LOC105696721 [Orussus abietinus]